MQDDLADNIWLRVEKKSYFYKIIVYTEYMCTCFDKFYKYKTNFHYLLSIFL